MASGRSSTWNASNGRSAAAPPRSAATPSASACWASPGRRARPMIVDLLPTEDQQLVSDSVESFLRDALPVDRLREDTGFGGAPERGLWADLAGLGLFGLGLSEDQG